MAKNSIGLFMQQISQAEDDDKVKVAKIVFDLFMVHDPFKLLTGVMSVSDDGYHILLNRISYWRYIGGPNRRFLGAHVAAGPSRGTSGRMRRIGKVDALGNAIR
jgi:hypothetical protein